MQDSRQRIGRSKACRRRKRPLWETKAAKFREETPRKGGGFADGSAIPRCNNMMELDCLGKSCFSPKPRFFPMNSCIFHMPGVDFVGSCFGLRHLCGAIRSKKWRPHPPDTQGPADSSVRLLPATKDSRASATPGPGAKIRTHPDERGRSRNDAVGFGHSLWERRFLRTR